jgi:hypothetical protein
MSASPPAIIRALITVSSGKEKRYSGHDQPNDEAGRYQPDGDRSLVNELAKHHYAQDDVGNVRQLLYSDRSLPSLQS